MSNRLLPCCLLPLLLLILFVPACSDKPKNPVAEYGNALVEAPQKARNAAVVANLDTVQRAVQQYRTINEKYPESLKDIEGTLGSSVDFSNYNYDPQTGKVSLK